MPGSVLFASLNSVMSFSISAIRELSAETMMLSLGASRMKLIRGSSRFSCMLPKTVCRVW